MRTCLRFMVGLLFLCGTSGFVWYVDDVWVVSCADSSCVVGCFTVVGCVRCVCMMFCF